MCVYFHGFKLNKVSENNYYEIWDKKIKLMDSYHFTAEFLKPQLSNLENRELYLSCTCISVYIASKLQILLHGKPDFEVVVGYQNSDTKNRSICS